MNVRQLYSGMTVAIKYGKWDSSPEKAEIIKLEYARGARHKVRFLTGPKIGETVDVTSRSIIPWTTEMDQLAEDRDFERKKKELETEFKKQQNERARRVAEEVLGFLVLLGCKGEVKQNHYAYKAIEEPFAIWITNPSEVQDRLREIATQTVQH
jgi:hypothetical protein